MKLIKSGLIATATVGVLAASIAPAAAIPYGSNTVYKVMDATYGSTVYISATANSRVQVQLGSVDRSTARIAGACGELRISVPSSGSFEGLKVDSMAIDASALPTQVLPACTSGTFAEARTANFKTPNGQVVIVGKTPGSAVAITLPSTASRNVSINACGFGILRASSGSTLPDTFDIGTNSYTLASLADAGDPPICRTTNGVSSAYIPSSWP
ncbi:MULTISPECIES: hypothetical protein [Nostoc]|uniref:Uncharacterized protein n=1 Tax=Nostoc cf. commune SO-36 TaxID=449208 RepID=A0ABN6QHR5_NOSCO|nr:MULTISPECIES: hypothetical protein [Nostoc]MEA5626874.1 hypothetical protein [Nostoc sp. UHCC 0251]BDI20962.1 hypothetical protein ANSO36C_67640 [Nostoc cf. commune SO-36]